MSERFLLPRLLSRWNVASRRQAEELVHAGKVAVNGKVVRDVMAQVDPHRDRVAVDGRPVGPTGSAPTWLALNKPRGVITTTHDPEGRPTIRDLVPGHAPGLAPVGRLDRDSAGLLLLTDEHAVAARLLDPSSHVAKVYRVKVRGHPDPAALERLRTEPIIDRGERLGPIGVTLSATGPRSAWLEVTLTEGRNRQIRRQLAAVGHEVELLIRTRFGPVDLGDLAPGVARPLTDEELRAVRAHGG